MYAGRLDSVWRVVRDGASPLTGTYPLEGDQTLPRARWKFVVQLRLSRSEARLDISKDRMSFGDDTPWGTWIK